LAVFAAAAVVADGEKLAGFNGVIERKCRGAVRGALERRAGFTYAGPCNEWPLQAF
jgi:hypothetical protein